MPPEPTPRPVWRRELRALTRLALPVIGVQVGMMAMGFVDSIMVGRYAETHLAALGLANFYSMVLMMFGLGVLMALDPLLSQAVGARDERAIGRNLQRGFVLVVVLSVPTAIGYLLVESVLSAMGQNAELVAIAAEYVWAMIPGLVPFYGFQVLRSMMQAHHRTAPIVWAILLANLANVGLNQVWIFGEFGFPPMGARGSAWATVASRWLMFVGLFFWARVLVWPRLRNWSRRALELRPLLRLLRIGAPVGAQLCLEFGAFGMTLSMMGWISVSALAGHQAAITLASMTYMVPLGLSVATGVRVGDAVGRGDPTGARWSAGLGFLLGAGMMVCFALVFLLFPVPLAALFTSAEAVGARQVTLALLPIAAAFQVMDGVQVVALGALRGIADTQVPMWINLGGFWVLGIPAGAWLAFRCDLGPAGLWWGLTIGLTAVAIALAWRTFSALGGELARNHIDEDD